MRKTTLIIAAIAAFGLPGRAFASGPLTKTNITGEYVEARTAEVFTGGCIMGMEGEPGGREAILAWRVGHGTMNGVALDGLSIVAVVAADTNLGMQELGGAPPKAIKAALRVDGRATPQQRDALIALARSLAPAVIRDVVDVKAVPIDFTRDGAHVAVAAGEARLDVMTHMHHDPTCGALQWFQPLATTTDPTMGVTVDQSWSGSSLGTQWAQSDRRSSFIGTFAIK